MPNVPLSLYIHLPWCVRKCPYCDFNSHEAKDSLPEELYVAALIDELRTHASLLAQRPLISIFFGGGTPSLFSPEAIARILQGVHQHATLAPDCEITLEANPGTIDQDRFIGFRAAGVNRLSLGIQSLDADKLKTLGRIHDREQALRAMSFVREAGFSNFNVDIMYGLPQQTIDEALEDIKAALTFKPTHFSWYQLTIEPNTLFHHQPPTLPPDDALWEMQQAGQALIHSLGYQQYEVSAYAQPNRECLHNRNYWEFSDYLGIGAGAHSKITDVDANGKIWRMAQVKNPRDYLEAAKRRAVAKTPVNEKDRAFEFMLNALRLTEGVPAELFEQRTGLSLQTIAPLLNQARERGLLEHDTKRICPSERGRQYLNDLMGMFL
jgi:putative oxygen-independent coproporphyrinogen III oxidase